MLVLIGLPLAWLSWLASAYIETLVKCGKCNTRMGRKNGTLRCPKCGHVVGRIDSDEPH
jgi:Zn finger protein HypA/HybF involved in hydrogenase expression